MAVGDVLRQAREKLGLTLEDVEEATKIRRKYIIALEENNFNVIPGSVYVRGFLRSYASFLQLDGDKLIQEFNENNSTQIDNMEPLKEAAAPEALKPRPRKGRIVIAGAVFVLAGFIYLLSVTNAGLQQNKLSDNADDQKITDQSSNETNQQSNNADKPGSGGEKETPAENGMDVVLQVTDSACWMKIMVDNQDAFEGMVWPGNVKTFKGEESVQLKLGNAGAVKVIVNGRDYGYLGAPGQVITRAFQIGNNDGASAGG